MDLHWLSSCVLLTPPLTSLLFTIYFHTQRSTQRLYCTSGMQLLSSVKYSPAAGLHAEGLLKHGNEITLSEHMHPCAGLCSCMIAACEFLYDRQTLLMGVRTPVLRPFESRTKSIDFKKCKLPNENL